MTSSTHVWLEGRSSVENEICVSAMIESPQSKPVRLWYRFPVETASLLTESGDPFVLGTLFLAMRAGTDLVIHGQVSPSLLKNLEEYQALWACWQPSRYRRVGISCDLEREDTRLVASKQAVVAFSGGVDSCFTVWRHRTNSCGRLKRKVSAGLMVHGFDIPLEKKKIFDRAAARSALLLESLNVGLIPMASNFRSLGDYWGDAHGAAVASCLMMLQGGYDEGLIGSTWTYDTAIPWGSSPVGDWMLSNQMFQNIHDGAAFSRADKLQTIASWPEAQRYLRVCWAGRENDRNCCHCEKCIRTILNFRALGLGLPKCFERDVSDQQIANLAGLQAGALNELKRVLILARQKGLKDSWVDALEKCVRKNQRALDGWTLKRVRNGLQRRLPFAHVGA